MMMSLFVRELKTKVDLLSLGIILALTPNRSKIDISSCFFL